MPTYTMEHIHLFSEDSIAAGKFYADAFGVTIREGRTWEGLPRCDLRLGGLIVLISTIEGDMQETVADRNQQLGIPGRFDRSDAARPRCRKMGKLGGPPHHAHLRAAQAGRIVPGPTGEAA